MNTDSGNIKADDMEADAGTPIFHAIAHLMAVSKAARTSNLLSVADAAQKAASETAERLYTLAAAPTAWNRTKLIKSISVLMLIREEASKQSINPPMVKRYQVDYTANHIAYFFYIALNAMIAADFNNNEDGFSYLAALYDEALKSIFAAIRHLPIRHADATAATIAIDAMNEAVIKWKLSHYN